MGIVWENSVGNWDIMLWERKVRVKFNNATNKIDLWNVFKG